MILRDKMISLKEFYDSLGKTVEDAAEHGTKLHEFLGKHNRQVCFGSTIRNDEIEVLSLLAEYQKPDMIIETGTNEGISTTAMALSCNATIHTYDFPSGYSKIKSINRSITT